MIDLDELRKLLATMSIPSTESKLIFSELEKRGFWIGLPKNIGSWHNVSKETKERVGKCQICGEIGGKNGMCNLVTHHKYPLNGLPYQRTLFNSPSNLLVLCYSCHGKLHYKLRGKQLKHPDDIPDWAIN